MTQTSPRILNYFSTCTWEKKEIGLRWDQLRNFDLKLNYTLYDQFLPRSKALQKKVLGNIAQDSKLKRHVAKRKFWGLAPRAGSSKLELPIDF